MPKDRGPRYSKEEFKVRGEAIFETKIRPNLKNRDKGRFAAIDIETEDYEIAASELEACRGLRARVPVSPPGGVGELDAPIHVGQR